MCPRENEKIHPTGPLFLKYACDGYLMEVGWPWTKKEIMTVTERGLHKSALALNAIGMMHAGVASKVEDGFAELVYLDEIEDLLESPE